MNKAKVIAKKGTKCPREEDPRRYITDSATVEVKLTPYYRACIRDGSLEDAGASAKVKKETSTKTKKEAKTKAAKKEV